MRRHLNYANVTATLALVFAMSGGALAANHYLINSTKQISPKVLTKLKGNAGPGGPTGPAGPVGAAGAAGPSGPAGTAGAAGSQGKEGAAGKEGPAGSAVAYAEIDGLTKKGASLLNVANSKNVSAATEVKGSTDAYCITTTVPFKNVTGITDLLNGGGNGVTVSANVAIAPLEISAGACPEGTTIIVTTGSSAEGKAANFWISFN
jgi:Collagen triple helix repeat (20 copies)